MFYWVRGQMVARCRVPIWGAVKVGLRGREGFGLIERAWGEECSDRSTGPGGPSGWGPEPFGLQ